MIRYKRQINNKENIGIYIKSRFLILGIIIVFIFMFAQLLVLSMYGTKGDELSRILKIQKGISLENDTLISKINEAESIKRIEDTALNKLGLNVVTNIKTLDISEKVSLK